ncbi:hypothetical protein M9434_004966 [Picochlorum sp. BPE23]|nr:hypothetical protein M9434_004966 [Picochlorum sp. BPE23]
MCGIETPGDPVSLSVRFVKDSEKFLRDALDCDLSSDTSKDVLEKSKSCAEKAIEVRPRWALGHLQKARVLELVGGRMKKEKEDAALAVLEEAVRSYERAFELDPSLIGEQEENFRELRKMVSSMACCFFATTPKRAVIYDSIECDLGGKMCFICATSDGGCYVCDGMMGSILAVCRGHSDAVTTLALSPSKEWLFTGSLDQTARIWRISTIERVIETAMGHGSIPEVQAEVVLEGHENRINGLVCTPCNSVLITSSTDSTLRIWDIKSGHCLGKMTGHSSLVSSIALSTSGDMCASASGDSVCRLWNVPDGSCFEQIAWESGPVVLCDFIPFSSHGEYLMTAHAQLVQQEARILLWDVYDKETGWVDGKLSAPCMAIDGLRGCPTSADSIMIKEGEFEAMVLLACACSDGFVHIWDITDTPVKLESFCLEEVSVPLPQDIPAWTASSLRHASNRLNIVKFSPSGKYVATTRSETNSLMIWDVEGGDCVCHFSGHTNPIRNIMWKTDYRIYSFSEDGSIRGWLVR